MLPSMRRGQTELAPPGGWRKAAVLVLLYPGRDGHWSLPLIERSATIGHHRGEIGFPGGSLETGEGVVEAALREAREELGLGEEALAALSLLGLLSILRVPPSGFEIHPVLAWLPEKPRILADEREVASVLELPLALILDPGSRRIERQEREGRVTEKPYYPLGDHRIWGATAMILAELAALVG